MHEQFIMTEWYC